MRQMSVIYVERLNLRSSNQLQDMRPRGAVGPDAVEVDYEGPALLDEARRPIEGYYE